MGSGFFSQDNPPPVEQSPAGPGPGNVVVEEPTGVDGATASFFGRGAAPALQAFEEDAKAAADEAAASAAEAAASAVAAAASAGDALNTASAVDGYVDQAEAAKNAAQASATNAAGSATAAAGSASAASTSATQAATSATNAGNSATSAATSATNSAASAASAASSASQAASSANSINAAAETATAKAAEATTSATNAANSATSAASSASTATTKASEAAASASAASGSATSASNSASSAGTSATTATTKASEAATSANNAATSAATATTKASEASTSATSASNSATSASGSAATATTKASEASTSATNAAASAATATTKASEASTSATNAADSATAAGTSATNAASSASAAGTSATNAATSATNAATSAATATTKASEAAASATSASGSASTATTKASEASTSASNAAASASTASTKASEASTSATNAANSASSASTSATNAANSASAAGTSASSASTSATNAATSATSAANSATAAAGSASTASSAQAAAESARDATLAAFDSFDDRYLGTKTSNPTVDNDGNALVAGALYFNSTAGEMRVWTGSAWTAAYVSGAGVLLIANNLSDLASASTARTNLGLGNVENKSSATIRSELTSGNVTTALGYTPYNSSNPAGYITGITSGNVTTALGYTPANKAGDTFTGNITLGSNWIYMSYNGGDSLRMNAYGYGFDFFNQSQGTWADIRARYGYINTVYDSDNTAYYVDPASSGTSANFAGRVQVGSNAISATAPQYSAYFSTHPYGVSSGDDRTHFGYFTGSEYHNYIRGAWTSFHNYITVGSSVRSSLFYDSDNTAYYVDASGTSVLGQINFGDSSKFIRGGASGQVILGAGSANDAYIQVGGSYYPIWNSGNFTPGNYLPLTGGTISGVLTVQNSNDAQLYLNGNGTTWAGISWSDVGGTDYMWYYGGTSTFAIGGGGSSVASKKLHVHGGTTIGSGLAGTSVSANGLLVESRIDAPVFYDSNDTGYYVNPNGTSNLTSLVVANTINGSVSGLSGALRSEGYGDGTLTYYQTPGDFAGTTGWAHYIIANHGSGASYYNYMMRLPFWSAPQYRRQTGDTSSVTPWYTFLSTENYAQYAMPINGVAENTVDVRAPVFYDYNNTAYFVDPNSNSVLNTLYFRNSSGANVLVGNASTFGYSSAYRTLLLGNQTNTTVCIGVDPIANPSGSFNGLGEGREVMFRNGVNFITPNSANNSYHVPLNMTDGYVTSSGSFRAPIFYDSNNTGYYVDPDTTSNLNAGFTSGQWKFRSNPGNGVYSGAAANLGLQAYSDDGGSAHLAFHRSGHYAVNMGLDPDNYLRIGGWSAAANRWVLDMSGNNWVAGSSRAPVFYDSDNTGYYVDPNGSSSLYSININNNSTIFGGYGNSSGLGIENQGSFIRFAFHDLDFWDWSYGSSIFRLDNFASSSTSMRAPIFYDSGNTGYYVDPTGASYCYEYGGPVTYGSYGSISVSGSTNGYAGIAFPAKSSTLMIGDGVGTPSGFYFTNNAWGMYCYKNSLYTNVIYDLDNTAHYVDPTGTSVLTTVYARKAAANNTPAIEVRGGNPGYPRIQTYSLEADSNAWMGLGVDMGGTSYEHSLYFPYGTSAQGRLSIGDYNGTTYNPRLWVYTSYTQINNSVRSPLFYDSDNTNYYVNPAGASALNSVTFGLYPTSAGGGGQIVPATGSPYSLRQDFGSDNTGWRYGIAKNVSGTATVLFYVQDNGDCVAVGNVTAYSDIRIKAGIETIPGALNKLSAIRGVTYTRTDMDDKDRRYAGVIAQEIEQVLPEAVSGDDDHKTVDYNATIALLIEAIKELKTEVDNLKATVH